MLPCQNLGTPSLMRKRGKVRREPTLQQTLVSAKQIYISLNIHFVHSLLCITKKTLSPDKYMPLTNKNRPLLPFSDHMPFPSQTPKLCLSVCLYISSVCCSVLYVCLSLGWMSRSVYYI